MSAIKKILVPTDFSEASRESLKYACTLAEALHASVCVLHVTENPYLPGGYFEYYAPPPDFFEQFERDARKHLEELLTPEEKIKYHATLVLRTGGAAHEILKYVREAANVDLVVMATHGRSGVARLMMGSVADKVVRAAPCPVVTMCPAGLAHDADRAA